MMKRQFSDISAPRAPARPDAASPTVGADAFGSILTIDLDAIRANYLALCAKARPATCAVVVKADAYGLGVAHVAPVLAAAGCQDFFVATLAEGIALRAILGPAGRIAVLNGLVPDSEPLCLAANLTPIINSLAQYRAYGRLARHAKTRLPIIVQFDSGMTRFGLCEDDGIALAAEIQASDQVEVVLVMSHLACAPQRAHPANAAQLEAFVKMAAWFPGVPRSLAASSGIFLGPAFRFEMVRPGAALFGISPCQGEAMRPVVRLQGRIMQMRDVPAGTFVGYGHEWQAMRASRLATIAVGYADGVPRSASRRASAWHEGHRLPAAGCVSMDSLVVDATGVAVAVGDLVDLIGPDHDVDAAATAAGTIGYEILTGLGHRFQRVYLEARE